MVKTIETGVHPINGLAFGGPNRDILFLLSSSGIINHSDGQVTNKNGCGSAEGVPLGSAKGLPLGSARGVPLSLPLSTLYKVTGLNAVGKKSTTFKLPTSYKGC